MNCFSRTYNEVELIPGPNLNLILGPNGNGKSAIVSAICLGMAGKPSTIARASSVSGNSIHLLCVSVVIPVHVGLQLSCYVRHGVSKAIINIELHNSEGQKFLVTREITLDNKSAWKYQGKPVSSAQVIY